MFAPSEPWRTGHVFTPAPAFGKGYEIQEHRVVTIKPGETQADVLDREGFPRTCRIAVIDT